MNRRYYAALGQQRSISVHLQRPTARGKKAVCAEEAPPIEMFQVWADNKTIVRRYKKPQDVLIPKLSTTISAMF